MTVALGNVHKWMLRLMLRLGEDIDTSCFTQQVLMDSPAVLYHNGCTRDILLQNFHPQRKGQTQKRNCVVRTRHRLEACLFVSFCAFHALS